MAPLFGGSQNVLPDKCSAIILLDTIFMVKMLKYKFKYIGFELELKYFLLLHP